MNKMVNFDNKIKFHLTNNYLSCDTCKQHDKLIRLTDFNESKQEDFKLAKAIHLIAHHGYKV